MKLIVHESPNLGLNTITERKITATVIECPGRWEDSIFEALQIDIEGVATPFVMTMALPKVCYRALSPFVRPADLYAAIAAAINGAQASINVECPRGGADV